MSVPARDPSRLAFKAYEIEELVDVYFYRRAGILVARGAHVLGLSANALSIAAAAIGIAGGVLLADRRLALLGFACLVLHGIVDSADGQLARLTGQTSEFGRFLDGLSGYLTHVAMYAGIALGAIAAGRGWGTLGWAVAAGLCTAMHAQMYDYHRNVYAAVVIHGTVADLRDARPDATTAGRAPGGALNLISTYEWFQRRVAAMHPAVERAIAARATGGVLLETDRQKYRASFYRLVRGWNLLGDNMRRYAVGVLAAVQHLEWMFPFVLLPMNALFIGLWLAQWRADRQFLATLR